MNEIMNEGAAPKLHCPSPWVFLYLDKGSGGTFCTYAASNSCDALPQTSSKPTHLPALIQPSLLAFSPSLTALPLFIHLQPSYYWDAYKGMSLNSPHKVLKTPKAAADESMKKLHETLFQMVTKPEQEHSH